eukprot:gene26479-31835_t
MPRLYAPLHTCALASFHPCETLSEELTSRCKNCIFMESRTQKSPDANAYRAFQNRRWSMVNAAPTTRADRLCLP